MEDPALVLAPRPSANTGDLKSPVSAPRVVNRDLRELNLPFHRAIPRSKSAGSLELMHLLEAFFVKKLKMWGGGRRRSELFFFLGGGFLTFHLKRQPDW